MNVLKYFYGDASHSAIILIHKMPPKDFLVSPQSLSRTQTIPSCTHILPQVFGHVCYVHSHRQHRGKLELMTFKCIFLGSLSIK